MTLAGGSEERRIVTVLFADLVGSTSLTERLDPEEAKLILGDAVGIVIRVVESFGGYIKDIAGDGVLAFFGAPVAHEDDPERATRAGLDIVRAVATYSDQVREGWGAAGLSVRVGINTGEVVVGLVGAGTRVEYGAVGDAVNVAARLQAAAEAGTVIVSEAARRSIEGKFEWGPPINLELKGKSAPVVAYLAGGVTRAAAGGGENASERRALVGRSAELDVLESLVTGAVAGQGGILLISGEPGIGKSRLAQELRAIAARRGIGGWLEGRCVSYGEPLPYWPYRDLLRGWLGLGSDDPEVRIRVTLMRRLEQLFPGRSAETFPFLAAVLGLTSVEGGEVRLAQVSPESIQYRTFEVMVELVSALCAVEPLLLTIDDLHWADPTSLALTERLMAVTETLPLLLVLTTRPDTEHPSWELKERAAREYRHLYRELALGPLAPESESELLDSLAGHRALTAESKRRILAYSAGNAFYLEEIVRSVGDVDRSSQGTLDKLDKLEIPPTIEGVLLARLDRLHASWRDVLTAASVLGRSFTLELLCAVTGDSAEDVRAALHHLLRLDLLQSERSGAEAAYRFKHALIQQTAYNTLVAGRRSLLHRRAAGWFESFYAGRLDSVYGLIAHHWRAADDVGKAAVYLRLAGDRALREWALDEAADHLRSLLSLLVPADDDRATAEVLFQLASTLHLALRYREANEVWREAFARWTYPEPAPDEPSARFRIATNQVPWSADVSTGYYATNLALGQQLWERLLDARPAPYVVPGLASWWEVSEDGLTYRLRLREGVSWNDGRPMVAADVVETLRRIVDPDHPSLDSTMLFVVENAEARTRGEVSAEALGVRAIDERTVEIRLNRRVPHFLFYLAYPQFSATRTDIASSGPFRLVSMDASRVIAERDPAYSRRRGGNVARIEWVLARDPESLERALRAGEIDAVWGHVRLEMDPAEAGLTLLPTTRTQTGFIGFIGEGRFASDRGLRRALALAIDREALGAAFSSHQSIALGGLVPVGIAGHSPGIALGFDPEAARAALAGSAHRGAVTLAVSIEHAQPYVDLLAGMWRDHLGLEVEVLWEPMARNREWVTRSHAAIWHWVAHAPDPEYFLHNLLHEQSLSKLGSWTVPRLSELLERALQAADGAARMELYHQADRLAVQEECVIIPLSYAGIRWLLKPWVHGVWQWGAPWQSWDEIRIEGPGLGGAAPSG